MAFLPDLVLPSISLTQLLQRLVAVAIVIGVHGFIVAGAAGRLGDPGPGYDGRTTPNPLAQLDLLGFIHAIFFRLPWMPHVDIDVAKLRGGVLGALGVTLLGSAGLALLSAAVLALRPVLLTTLPGEAAVVASGILGVTADVAIIVAVLHLLPMPPLVGAMWVPLPAAARVVWRGPVARWVGTGLIVLASLTGVVPAIASAITRAWRSLLGY